MTVTFLDTPGTEVSQTEAIGVMVTNLTGLVIGAGRTDAFNALEVVWDGSAFLYPYLSSTHNGTGTFQIVRTGGWPEDFKVRVFEQVPVPTAAQKFGLLYECDFTTLASQTMGSLGSYTIDGKTWWQKGGTQTGRNNCALVNGSGLGFTWASSAAAFDGTSTIEYRMLAMPLAQLANYNADAPIIFQMVFGGSGYDVATNYILGGFIDAASSSAAWASGERNRQTLVGIGAASTSALQYIAGSTATTQSRNLATPWTDPTAHAFEVHRPTRRTGLSGRSSFSGSFADPFETADGRGELMSSTTAPSNPCFGLVFNSQSTFSAYLRRLRILQPVVSA